MIARIDEARSNGDTVGGVFEVVARGAADRPRDLRPLGPPARRGAGGRGHEHQHRQGRRVRARASSRPAGSARRSTTSSRAATRGGRWIHRSNNAGGLTGGVSNGEPIVVRGAVKPISTLARPLPSADLVTGEPVEKAHYERSDISVVPAAGVVGEAMVHADAGRLRARQVRRRLDRRRATTWRATASGSPRARGAGRRRPARDAGRRRPRTP